MQPGAFVFTSCGRTHCGKVRPYNEDAFMARDDIGVWAVADGMGGHTSGDYASNLIVENLTATAPPTSARDLMQDIKARLQAAHTTLQQAAVERGPGTVIASTVVVLMAFQRHYACLWAGDSRIYLARDGGISQLTHDHSYVQELIDGGMLAPERANSHPYANVVTRAVGTEHALDLDVATGELGPNDRFVLCSDGLTRLASDEQIAAILAAKPPEAAADALIDAALDGGARDNVTAVVVDALPGGGP